jgi:DNA-binding transcriptional LysR family regulator
MNKNQLLAMLPDLATYTLVVQEGNFTNAAKTLAMTPSALSKTITRLEKSLAVQLIERTTRSLRVTEEGQRVFEQAIQMLNAAQQAVELSAQSQNNPQGSISISAPEAYLSMVLQPLVVSFLQQYPDIQLKLRAIDGPVDIFKNGIDVSFQLSEQPNEQLVVKNLGHTDLVLCATPKYLSIKGTPKHPSDLMDHHCLYLAETEYDNVWRFYNGEQSHSVTVFGRYAVNQAQLRLDGVKNDLGIGLFHAFVITDSVAKGEVVQVLSDWTVKSSYHGDILMQYAQTKYMPTRIRLFIDYIEKALLN